MKLKDIKAYYTFDLWMKPEISGENPPAGVGYFAQYSIGSVYSLRINGMLFRLYPQNSSETYDLNHHLNSGCAHLAEVMATAPNDCVQIRVVFFNAEIVEIGDVEIGIDDQIVETAKRNGFRFKGAEELAGILNEKCNLQVSNENYFIILSGLSAKRDFEMDIQEKNNQSISQSIVQEKYQVFSICGERVRIPVERRKINKEKEIYYATKAIFEESQNRDGALRLARGRILFSDYTRTGEIRSYAMAAMRQIIREPGSYLKKWDEYGAIEGNFLLEKARAVGKIEIENPIQTNNGVRFFVSTMPDLLVEGDEMEVTSQMPVYLEKLDMDWNEYSRELEIEFKPEKTNKENTEKYPETLYAKIISLTKNHIELDLPSRPDKQKFLILSINGEKIQIERRRRARSAILEGRSAKPQLGQIIEEGDSIPWSYRSTKLPPITSFVKDKIFKSSPPTDRQIEAIKIALNTPDIALIQGPPGTGKTTVIEAIIERLNEEFDKTSSIKGQVLVSGFQHDAVENIVSRLSVNAFPSVKFGKRSSDSEFSEDAVTKKILSWCSQVAEDIRKQNPEIKQTEHQIRLSELFRVYNSTPSKNNTINLAKYILKLPKNLISDEIVDAANEILDSQQSNMRLHTSSTIQIIRSLRVNKIAFCDDGADRAIDLLEEVSDDLSADERNTLELASRWKSSDSMDFLQKLGELKKSLLFRYLPAPDYRTEKVREDVWKLVVKVTKILDRTLKTDNKRERILAEFLHELENNPSAIRDAIANYNFVFAATTQQSVGHDILRIKRDEFGYNGNSEMPKYDTVIIDEAARTSPRDLLIPMVMAEKRIILVGDHRQLPHLIDMNVASKLEKGDSSDWVEHDFIKDSMFKYLFDRLKKLEKHDGIKRTVTLDKQYRTHPSLGKFVNANFYEKYGENLSSPLPSEHFSHKLKGIEDKAAIWIDVPNSSGPENVQSSGSRRREAEARVIAKYLNEWINSEQAKSAYMKKLTGNDEHPGLSFGIISFYKAQEIKIREALVDYGITKRAQDKTLQITPSFRAFENGEERLRIGTVDAFQGMEFDFVFLSMVRTRNIQSLSSHAKDDESDQKEKQKTFGHLMSENRLCVSMSRQKRALAIVGDGKLVQHKIASEAVPALQNFHTLCREQGVIL